MKYIEIDIAPNGEAKIEAHGFTGGACLAATKEIEAAIGKLDTRKVKDGSTATVVQKLKQ